MNQGSSAIRVSFKNEQSSFLAGDLLEGYLNYAFSPKEPLSNIEVRLGWIVSSADQSDIMCHCVECFKISSHAGTAAFQVVLPLGPHSYKGQLFSIKWLVEATSKNGRHVFTLPFTLHRR